MSGPERTRDGDEDVRRDVPSDRVAPATGADATAESADPTAAVDTGFEETAPSGLGDTALSDWASNLDFTYEELAHAIEPTPVERTGPRATSGIAVSLEDDEVDPAGPPWVLLRGLMRDRRHWGSLPGRIGMFAEGQVVEAFDLPGNGSRYRERSPTSIAEMVEVLRTGLRRRGIEPPVRVLAMSLGAMVAIEWARLHPEEVVGLVLINTSVKPLSPLSQRLHPRQWWPLLRLALLPARAVDWESTVLTATSRRYRGQGSQARAALLERWVNWRKSQPVSRGNALRQLWAASRYRADTPPPVPGLLMVSARDQLVDPRCSHAIAQDWGWPLLEHPKAGHDLPLDDPGWVLDRLRHRFEDPAAPRRRKARERIQVDEVEMPMPSGRRRASPIDDVTDIDFGLGGPPRLAAPRAGAVAPADEDIWDETEGVRPAPPAAAAMASIRPAPATASD